MTRGRGNTRRENRTTSVAKNIAELARASQLYTHALRPLIQTQCSGEPNVTIRAPLHLKRDGHNARKLVAPSLGAAYARTTQGTFRYSNFGRLTPTVRYGRGGPQLNLDLQHAYSRRRTVMGRASLDVRRRCYLSCQIIDGPLLPGTWPARGRQSDAATFE